MVSKVIDFESYLNSIDKETIRYFASLKKVKEFIEEVCYNGSVELAATKRTISPIVLHKIISSDKNLNKCVQLAIEFAIKVAEGILYERAVNGYEEEIYKDGECIGMRKKYSDKALIEFLKANSLKYQTKKGDRETTNVIKVESFGDGEDS